MRLTPVTSLPSGPPKGVVGAVHSNGAKGVVLSCDVTSGNRSLLLVRYLDSDAGWRAHPIGTVVFDSAAGLGTATDDKRYVRLGGDATDTWYHVIDQGGTGTLAAVYLSPVDFF